MSTVKQKLDMIATEAAEERATSTIVGQREPKDDFRRGYLAAAAEVMRVFNKSTVAFQLMTTAGVTTKAELRKTDLEAFDREPLKIVLRQEGAR